MRSRLAIAQAVVAGTPIAVVERELGVTRSWASREAHAPSTCALIDELMGQQLETIAALLPLALDTLQELLKSRRMVHRDVTAFDRAAPDFRTGML